MNLLFEVRRVLVEANAVLWHSTSRAPKIIADDCFQLTFAGGTHSDNLSPGKQFYLSCSRIPHGGYSHSEYYKNVQFKFQLDGQKLAHRFRIIPVQYWGGEMARQYRERDENEDRVVTAEHEIRPASKYTTALHVFIPSDEDLDRNNHNRRALLQLAEPNNFKILYYRDAKAYQLADMRKATTESPVFGPAEFHEPYDNSGFMVKEEARLKAIADWLETGKSEDEYQMRCSWSFDYHTSVECDVHNARSYKLPAIQKQLQRISKSLTKSGAKSVQQLVKMAQEKWNK